MAVLYQGQGPHDGIQYRPECDDDGLQCWRHRLRQEKSRALRRECRRYGSGVYRSFQGSRVSRDFSVQLADPYAISVGCPASEYRRGNDREMAGQRPRRDAKLVDQEVGVADFPTLKAAGGAVVPPGHNKTRMLWTNSVMSRLV